MTLWGGRFDDPPAERVWRFTVDDADHRLLEDDIAGSRAHARMLTATGIIDAEDGDLLVQGLSEMLEEAAAGEFRILPSDEDVHTAVERRLIELVGEAGKRLHTARSRNDQVVLDLRLYLRRAGTRRRRQIEQLIDVLVVRAGEVADVAVPSYTHLQQAQPVSLGHHLLAYAWMLLRDRDRFGDAATRISVSPLGAGAGGGTSLPIDPELAAAELDLRDTFDNSLDAVAARDFAAEYTFCCAQLLAHLSRLAADIVLWATAEFGWVTVPDAYATGSSALPHKRNPDPAELVRGKAPRVSAAVTGLLGIQHGLPLSYNRDLQEDKPGLFDADDTAAGALDVTTGLIAELVFHPPPPTADTMVLDLAEALVMQGTPFREAHETLGRMLTILEAEGRSLTEATAADWAAVGLDAAPVGDPAASMQRRVSPGGGSPASVRLQIEALRAAIGG